MKTLTLALLLGTTLVAPAVAGVTDANRYEEIAAAMAALKHCPDLIPAEDLVAAQEDYGKTLTLDQKAAAIVEGAQEAYRFTAYAEAHDRTYCDVALEALGPNSNGIHFVESAATATPAPLPGMASGQPSAEPAAGTGYAPPTGIAMGGSSPFVSEVIPWALPPLAPETTESAEPEPCAPNLSPGLCYEMLRLFDFENGDPPFSPTRGPRYTIFFRGDCTMTLLAGPIPCDQYLTYTVVGNGRSLFVFTEGDNSAIAMSGGSEKQPVLTGYYLNIDTIRVVDHGKEGPRDNNMTGECHINLSADATKFYYVRCIVWDRGRQMQMKFDLDNIQGFEKVNF